MAQRFIDGRPAHSVAFVFRLACDILWRPAWAERRDGSIEKISRFGPGLRSIDIES